MAEIRDEILEGFLTRLAKSERIDDALVKALRAVFRADGKLKADDLVAAYVAGKRTARFDSGRGC